MRLKPPDFVIIGAMRAGTTALASHLARHPEIAMSAPKETNFFIAERNYWRGFSWYESCFARGKRLRGEASPNYTKNDVFKGVPDRIYAARRDARLIYIVRDPVDRFWSQYFHSYLIAGSLPAPDDILEDKEGRHILAASSYHRQLQSYLALFPMRQILIVDFADLTNHKAQTLDEICAFVGARAGEDLSTRRGRNATVQIARLAPFVRKVTAWPLFQRLNAYAPQWLREHGRAALSRLSPQRALPTVTAAARVRVAEALAEDAAAFRALVGRPFASWSV